MPNKITINKGQRFGRLRILKELPPHIPISGGKVRKFLCVCDCGTERVARLNRLRSGRSTSCPCIRLTAQGLCFCHG